MLRDYQQRAIDDLYKWFADGGQGNPCLVLPTGAGKSHIVAALCKDALQNWPETRILMLTHVKELIEQNAEKMRQHWPNAPMGIYSASIGKRELGEPITFAGIQSVRTKANQIGHVDLIIVDECHLISHKDEGGYRTLIGELTKINPNLRVIGLTATPWRLGHGVITEGDALFDDLIEPVTIEELVYRGFLAPLRSKVTKFQYDISGVHKRGGEYVESELQAAVNTDPQNVAVVEEVIRLAGDRRSWLFFCTGVSHSEAIRDTLRAYGVSAECVTGATPKGERAKILEQFKAGKIKALTNCDVLTTGFDAPNIDLIAMLRSTMSPALYVQMAGRGLRKKDHTDHCLVLDFAGAVEQHGPITAVQPPKKAGSGGEAPTRTCGECGEICHASVRKCPCCGFEFPAPEAKPMHLRQDDIMGVDPNELQVTAWQWKKHTSRTSGVDMLFVRYYGGLSDRPVTEYLPVLNAGYAGTKARQAVGQIAKSAGVDLPDIDQIDKFAADLTKATPPVMVKYWREGKFDRVVERIWR